MKKICWTVSVLILAMQIVLAAPAEAEESPDLRTFFAIQRLDDTQKMLYLGFLAAIDYQQTVASVVKHPDQYSELNPILGRHPGRRELALFGAAGLTAVYVVQRTFYGAFSRVLVDSIIATEQINVWENEYVQYRSSMPIMVVASFSF